jgi:glutaredoxin
MKQINHKTIQEMQANSKVVIASLSVIILALCIVSCYLLYEQYNCDNKIHITVMTATWCHHCQSMKPELEKLQTLCSEKNISLEILDADADGEKVDTFDVPGFPAIFIGNKQYRGNRTADSIMQQILKDQ